MKKTKQWHEIHLTRTLIDKFNEDKSKLSKNEVKAVENRLQFMERKEKDIELANKEIEKNCRILCSGTQSCEMIPSIGWIDPVKKLCYELEALNLDYKKYGCKVTVAQTKSKYGTLRFYEDIVFETTGLKKLIISPLKFLSDCLNRINYKMKYIVDKEACTTVEKLSISEETYDDIKENLLGIGNNTVLKLTNEAYRIESLGNYEKLFIDEKEIDLDKTAVLMKNPDGTFFRLAKVWHSCSGHMEPTKYKLLHKISNIMHSLECKLDIFLPSFHTKKTTTELNVRHEQFRETVYDLIRKAEQECESRCEICGSYIDDKNTCIMSGWITYCCKECADVRGSSYHLNGKNYKEGKLVEKNK